MNETINKISNISGHRFQKVNTNKYEQGNIYDICKESDVKNNYVKIPRVSNISLLEEGCKTIFEKIFFVYENGRVIDNKYKEIFFNTISDNVYKSISKRHNMLKKSMFTFIYDSDYTLPDSKDVIMLLSDILKMNILITFGKTYHKYSEEFDRTLILRKDKNTVIKESLLEADMELVSEGYYRDADLDNMKMIEIKEYVKQYNIVIPITVKKKQDIINIIKEYIK